MPVERLILTCGRYTPAATEDTRARVMAMEAYLARLSEELEHVMGELARMTEGLNSRSAVTASNEEGGV